MAEENGMWGGGYWGEGYWGDGYWGIFGAAAAVAEAVVGVFPPLLRRRFTAFIPMLVSIRRSYVFDVSMSRFIRSLWRMEALISRLIRRPTPKSLITLKIFIKTKKFEKLLKTIYEFLKEE